MATLLAAAWLGGPTLSQTPGAGTTVSALGRLEPKSGLVIIGARPGARIERIAAVPRERVQAGALLAVLEGHAQAEAQLNVAHAQTARAEHERDVKKRQLGLERERTSKLAAARLLAVPRVSAARKRWDEIAALFKQLSEDKNLPPRDRFDVLLRYQEAEIASLRGDQELKEIEAAQQLAPRVRELEDQALDDKGPDQDLLNRQVELARTAVAGTEIHAPHAGEVLELLAHEGEVSSGPLLLFGDTSAMAAIAEVFQADAPRLRVGDGATVQILGTAVPGKVTAIGTVVGKNQINSLDPRALQDRRVVKVTVELDDPALARRLINMEVDVSIRPGGAAGSPGPASAAAR